jgi:hypothetical protein
MGFSKAGQAEKSAQTEESSSAVVLSVLKEANSKQQSAISGIQGSLYGRKGMRTILALRTVVLAVVGFGHETKILSQHLARRRMVHSSVRPG